MVGRMLLSQGTYDDFQTSLVDPALGPWRLSSSSLNCMDDGNQFCNQANFEHSFRNNDGAIDPDIDSRYGFVVRLGLPILRKLRDCNAEAILVAAEFMETPQPQA